MIMELKSITPDVAKDIAEALGIPMLFESRRRHLPLVRIRQRVFYLLAQNVRLSYSRIGWALGRHHATVMWAEKETAKRILEDPAELAEVQRLETIINQHFAEKRAV